MAALMIIINILENDKVPKLQFFGKVVRDIDAYVKDVHHFDIRFINLVFLFCRELQTYRDYWLL